ncbi:MAG: hypothetical protein WC588_02040, partial [Candidatus Micrarchaeia archaeon]
MKIPKTALIILLLILAGLPFAAGNETDGCAYFFYGTGCPHCAKVEPYLEPMAANGSKIVKFEVYSNRTNLALLNSFFDAYGVPADSRGVPVAFTHDAYFIGDIEILENLPSA